MATEAQPRIRSRVDDGMVRRVETRREHGRVHSTPDHWVRETLPKLIWPGGPVHHVLQGAFPPAHNSSNLCLSRRVSIGCQNPRWKNASTCFFTVRLCMGSASNI